MDKKGFNNTFGIILVAVLFLVMGFLMAFIFLGSTNYDKVYEEKITSGEIINPVKNLTTEEAIQRFDEDFVYYLLYSIKAYNLHTPFFNSEVPEIEFQINDDIYNAVIYDGEIIVSEGKINEEDIIIHTSKTEAVKMIQDVDYIDESFQNGDSSIEMVAEKIELFSKGYLEFYEDLTGEGITGFIIRSF